MAHRHDVYSYGNYIEHEYKYKGKYGRKGEKRAPRRKATPEQMKKQNQRNREKFCLRLMRANFFPDDLWVTLKFEKGTRLTPSELKKIRKAFFDELRRIYKNYGQALKYMYRIEIGERGGIHFHFLVNRMTKGEGTDVIIRRLWKKYGKGVDFQPTYEQGGFKDLAAYLVKPINEEISGQLTLFGDEEEVKIFSQYNRSRNLIVPEPETHEYRRRTVEKLVKDGPKPTEGYYIDQDSIVTGVNPYTGMSYYYYTEIRLKPVGRDTEKAEDLLADNSRKKPRRLVNTG